MEVVPWYSLNGSRRGKELIDWHRKTILRLHAMGLGDQIIGIALHPMDYEAVFSYLHATMPSSSFLTLDMKSGWGVISILGYKVHPDVTAEGRLFL
jgi:hypothetical protein